VAVGCATVAFPDGSRDLDELAYLSQAEALRSRQLTLPASTHDPYFLPFLSGVDGDRVVFKYQPAWPAVLASGRLLTGSYVPALALSAAAAAFAAYAFAWEAARRRAVSIIAGGLVMSSPFFVVQSGTYLAYMLSTTIVCAASAALLHGQRTSAGRWFVIAGALFGVGVFHRGFDALLFGVPVGAWLVWTLRHDLERLLRRLGQIVIGALPPLAAYAAYNWVATGSPVRFAFRVSGPVDTFGFGRRASFGGGEPGIDYTVGRAWSTLGEMTASLQRWLPGGLALLVLALVGAAVRRRESRTVLLVALVLVFPVGYFFWWGTANSVKHGLIDELGPFYWLPALVPLAVLAALGIEWLWERQRVLAVVLGAVCLTSTVVTAPAMARDAAHAGNVRSARVALEERAGPHSLLLVPPEFETDLYARTVVDADLDDSRVVALLPDDAGARFDLVERFPDREFAELYRTRPRGAAFAEHHLEFRPVEEQRYEIWDVTIELANPDRASTAVAYVRVGPHRLEQPLRGLDADRRRRVTFRIRTGRETGPSGPPGEFTVDARTPLRVAAGIALGDSRELEAIPWYELRWDVLATDDGALRVQDPPTSWERTIFPTRSAWGEADVSDVITAARPGR
jgi:hypothetical protein